MQAKRAAPVDGDAKRQRGAPPPGIPKRGRDGDDGGDQASSKSRIAMICAISDMCEEPIVEDEVYAVGGNFHQARMDHIEKIAGEGKQIVRVIPIAETTSKNLTRKWVDTY